MDDTAYKDKDSNASADVAAEGNGDTNSKQNSTAAEATDTVSDKPAAPVKGKKKKRSRRRIIITVVIIVVVVLLVLAAVLIFLFYRGALAPLNAAAKYDFFSYVYEEEVDDYIDTYREQMGLSEGEADETTWATFLSQYNLTPEILRTAAITELVSDDLVYKKCDQLDISVSDEEMDQVIDAAIYNYALGDEQNWIDTLDMYGQTEEGYEEVVRLQLLKEKLYSEEVEVPTPTDEEVVSYITSTIPTLDTNKTKHSYFFELSADEGESSYDNLKAVQEVRNLFLEGEPEEDYFTYLVTTYSNNDSLIDSGGANGWDIDTSDYDETYIQQLDGLSQGDVSTVFKTDTGYAFIWVDEVYSFPKKTKKLEALTSDDVPETLWAYLSDSEAYVLWQDKCKEYLANLYYDANVIIYDMPSDVPYNVDMELAQETTSAEDSDDQSSEETSNGGETSDGAVESNALSDGETNPDPSSDENTSQDAG